MPTPKRINPHDRRVCTFVTVMRRLCVLGLSLVDVPRGPPFFPECDRLCGIYVCLGKPERYEALLSPLSRISSPADKDFHVLRIISSPYT